MNRQLLLALQKRNKERLTELRTQVENRELRAEDLPAIQEQIDEINNELQDVADALANLDDEGGDEGAGEGEAGSNGDEGGTGDDGSNGDEGRSGNNGEGENRTGITPEQRNAAMAAINSGLSTRGHKTTKVKENEIRSAFANFVVGRITETEARALGIEAGNGSVTIPEVIASEIITYAQEENLLRKYGSVHRTAGDVKYPVLVKKADANVRKKERGASDEIAETGIEFDEILLSPAEFDALATVTKKLLKMTGAPIEQIVIDELKKAYVRKETNYMFNGNDAGNENPGALAKKAVKYYESEVIDINAAGYSQKLYQQLVKVKGQPVTEVLKKSMWLINRAALTVLEGMTDTTGRPLLYQAPDGVGYKLLGHNVDFTDAANGTDPTKPVFYFGDFKAFHIQDVIGAMELQKLIEKFSGTNKVGFQIYNLLDGQLVYSPFEPAVYRYEVGLKKV
ncbi:phage major capsid protein [Bacillus nitratireducens]|uniref:Phage major capsid protein n=1 Tax=Bacillus nitratireducens TaxID=2026193 RepID=A0ABU6PAY2_9BACI|nr:phage major capsid protein [Bacillus nitratireducens]MDR4172523.1 phage major capsid protein [Bacillus nitratireducens]MED4678465.1 phage major capsid protein [Bacillus nitratireducens]PGW38646.1 phage major capsid protein [Bacillus cereus]